MIRKIEQVAIMRNFQSNIIVNIHAFNRESFQCLYINHIVYHYHNISAYKILITNT